MSNEHELPAMSGKPTVELCRDELRRGVRCILPRGHANDHEFQDAHHDEPVRWKSGGR